jgi:hypothetical protein
MAFSIFSIQKWWSRISDTFFYITFYCWSKFIFKQILIKIYIILLLLNQIKIPFFFLEVAIGQFSGLSPSDCFAKMCPLFQGFSFIKLKNFYFTILT